MRVLSVAFPSMPVGTALGGGAEQILSIVEQGIVERGYQSVVVACKGSRVAGDLIESTSLEDHRHTIRHVLTSYPVDLIHFHGLDFHQYLPDWEMAMLATLHLPITFYPESIFESGRRRNLTLNCVSRSQADSTPPSRDLPVVRNGILTESYAPAEPNGFLLWLGRICPEKGVHIALEVAHRLNAEIIIAGPVHPYPEHLDYFSRQIKPLLDSRRTYIGPVELKEKRSLLSRAQCVLVPSLVAETSSLVAMEALSSGTPVIAFRTGALPEIVDDGETGFLVDSAEQMSQAVLRIDHLSRAHCRQRAVARFDSSRMIDAYLALYERIITRHLANACAPQENL
ncbi:MAG TPA: glycosyltransferase family 4 protein [Bryobacteraceae bacterium]|jgi:glycosyltransferase involved in cell wall biosynthesis|nr:glycosyltransferase family 4 protein [Bryobacteraceae bacterium]